MSASQPRACRRLRPPEKSFTPTRRGLHLVTLLVIGGLLGGCAVGPDYQKPSLRLPDRWHTAEAPQQKTPDLARWWTKLDDPALNAVVDEAVQGNLSVAAAKARIREARAGYTQAGGALFPTISATGGFTRSKSNEAVVGGRGQLGGASLSRISDQYQAGFDASWEADLFGANRRNVEAARYGLDAAEEDLRSTLLTLIGDVTQNYVQACGYRARIDLAKKTAAAQRETAALTQAKFESGSASAVDIASASGQASTTDAQVQSLETSYAQTVHRLGVLLGREPAALYDRLSTCVARPSVLPDVPMGVPADILLVRPDVRLAERRFAQATAKVGQAEAARYPSISLSGNVATSGVNLSDLAKSSTITWSFGPSISIPIFNAGRLEAAAEMAAAQRDEYYIAFRSAVLTALEDVENAGVSFSREHARNESIASAAKSYRTATELARSLYQSGSTSFLELLDSERTLYSAEDALIQSNVAIAIDYIALNKALGGGWDGVVDASKPEIANDPVLPHF